MLSIAEHRRETTQLKQEKLGLARGLQNEESEKMSERGPWRVRHCSSEEQLRCRGPGYAKWCRHGPGDRRLRVEVGKDRLEKQGIPGGEGVRGCKRDSRRFPNNDGSSQKLCMRHNTKSYTYLKREFFHFVF